jgi:hypothetical protein
MRRSHEAAPVPDPEMSPSRIEARVASLYGMTIPIQRAEPTKNKRMRQTKDRYAGGRVFRGFSASAATIDMYSGPQILSEC